MRKTEALWRGAALGLGVESKAPSPARRQPSAGRSSAPSAAPSVAGYRQNDEYHNDHEEQVASQVESATTEEQEQ